MVGVLAVGAVILALALANPAAREADQRNAQRQRDVQAIADAIATYQQDHGGVYPSSVAALKADTAYVVGTDVAGCNVGCTTKTTQASCVNLDVLFDVPMDPLTGTTAFSDYYLVRNAAGTVTVGACDAEHGLTIAVSR